MAFDIIIKSQMETPVAIEIIPDYIFAGVGAFPCTPSGVLEDTENSVKKIYAGMENIPLDGSWPYTDYPAWPFPGTIHGIMTGGQNHNGGQYYKFSVKKHHEIIKMFKNIPLPEWARGNIKLAKKSGRNTDVSYDRHWSHFIDESGLTPFIKDDSLKHIVTALIDTGRLLRCDYLVLKGLDVDRECDSRITDYAYKRDFRFTSQFFKVGENTVKVLEEC